VASEEAPPCSSHADGHPAVPLPRYGQASLADLVPSLLHALGVTSFVNTLRVEPVGRVCLLVVDGLGWELVRAHGAEAPFLASLAAASSPLTAGFPSTTAVSLASIGTGQPPGEHGMVGYTMTIPGYERAMNTLRWALHGEGAPVDLLRDIVPEQLQPHLTAFERAAMDGVTVTLLGPVLHERSGLTRAAFRGGRYRAVYSLGDLVAEAAQALAANRRGFVYAYHPDLDLTGHNRGVSSEAWLLHLGYIDRLAAQLAERLPADAVLVITGDHGMVDLAEEERIDLADVPALAAGVRLLGGAHRPRRCARFSGGGTAAGWRTTRAICLCAAGGRVRCPGRMARAPRRPYVGRSARRGNRGRLVRSARARPHPSPHR